jgi:hypothetical protein
VIEVAASAALDRKLMPGSMATDTMRKPAKTVRRRRMQGDYLPGIGPGQVTRTCGR